MFLERTSKKKPTRTLNSIAYDDDDAHPYMYNYPCAMSARKSVRIRRETLCAQEQCDTNYVKL